MDLNLARTFTTVLYSGSFVLAAERLCVSQTTVTARIKNLEEQLGVQLFVRSASGVSLTAAGERFVPHARQLLATWQDALQQVPGLQVQQPLRLAAETSLWQPWLGLWLAQLRQQLPQLQLTVELGSSQELLERLENGQLDALLSHQVRYRPDLQVQLLMEESLVLVSHAQQPEPRMHIDWGEDFAQQFELAFPGWQASFTTSVGPVGLQLLIEQGGTGYFRGHVVQPLVEAGQLVRVANAPEFALPIYLLSSRHCQHPQLQQALACAVQPAARQLQS